MGFALYSEAMGRKHTRRQVLAILVFLIGMFYVLVNQQAENSKLPPLSPVIQKEYFGEDKMAEVLEKLEIKGRAAKTGYSRSRFGDGWGRVGLCDTRNVILQRDLTEVKIDDRCRVLSGLLEDPYTGKVIAFERGIDTSQLVQIDHVVALSDAWQKGAQQLDFRTRNLLSNDPLNLLAVGGEVNQAKGDSDAASWLPPNKLFRCQYVARQIAVKYRYKLWVTPAEKSAMSRVINGCSP